MISFVVVVFSPNIIAWKKQPGKISNFRKFFSSMQWTSVGSKTTSFVCESISLCFKSSDLNPEDAQFTEVIDTTLAAPRGRDCNRPLGPPDPHRTAADLRRAVCGVTYCETASQLDKEMAHPHAHSQNTVLTAAIALDCQSPAVHHCVERESAHCQLPAHWSARGN